MTLKPLRRNYSMTDAELCSFTFNLISSITRDIVQFTARGITSVQTTALDILATAFEIFPNDEFYRADITIAVETKDNLRMGMLVKIRDIVQCAVIKWGDGSGQYKKFATKNIGSENDKSFLTTARQVVTVGTGYLSDLTSVGLTQAMLDSLEDDCDLFHTALISIYDAEELRDDKTQERIQKGNEIYELAAKYCQIGKIIWDDVDEAKYNDYVIYSKENSQLSKPQNLTAVQDISEPSFVNLAWDIVQNATEYKIFINVTTLGAPSGNFQLLNTTSNTSFQAPGIIEKRNYFKIRAKNDTQTSDYSDEAFVDLTIV